MLVDVRSFGSDNVVGNIDLSGLFVEHPRSDIIKRVVDWQLINRISGTRGVKSLSDVSGTGKKPHPQKKTGNARLGTLRPPQARGGAVAHKVKTTYSHDLPKKIRCLGLLHAMSLKLAAKSLYIYDNIDTQSAKTKSIKSLLASRYGDLKSCFVISGNIVDDNLANATRNLHYVNVVPTIGANVYDIIKHDITLVSRDALQAILDRYKRLFNDRLKSGT